MENKSIANLVSDQDLINWIENVVDNFLNKSLENKIEKILKNILTQKIEKILENNLDSKIHQTELTNEAGMMRNCEIHDNCRGFYSRCEKCKKIVCSVEKRNCVQDCICCSDDIPICLKCYNEKYV